MSGNKESSGRSVESSNTSTTHRLKYEKPKILLVDIKDATEAILTAEGYNVESGSFGAPYYVEQDDSYVPVIPQGNLPNYTEQEIIIIDLVPPSVLDKPQGKKLTSAGEMDWWIKCSRGVVDPRPRIMQMAQSAFDNILRHGGVFIVFADSKLSQPMKYMYKGSYGLLGDKEVPYHNWSFLSILSSEQYFAADYKVGREMSVLQQNDSLSSLLSSYTNEGEYCCTLATSGAVEHAWTPLAINKYRQTVAGVIAPIGNFSGWIFIFPQLENKARFLFKFLDDVLPDYVPILFPHLEGARWVHRSEYETPRVLELKKRIKDIEEETKQKVSKLESEIDSERAASEYLYALLRQTGDPLMRAVRRALEELGFNDVVDIDVERKKSGDTGQLREDLQIRDNSPLVLVEVKGINNLPKETHSLQVWKYIAPTMKKLDRTDVRGLSIINHQKNLPALDRENKNPFSPDILTNAESQDFGLLTTWDLYRLIRSYKKNGWKHEQIESLFYQNGRISPVPTHYQYVGMVDHFWENVGVLAIQIEDAEIRKGDRIAFELPIEFEEQIVDSLEIDNSPIEKAESGQRVAIKTHLTKQQAKNDIPVFRVMS